MKKTAINKIKKILEEERTQIIDRTKANANLDIDIDGDETDEIQGKILALTNNQLIARNKEKLAAIENAFRKIADGSYGICISCEEPIDDKRLTIMPHSLICISCAEQKELMLRKNRV
jgi:DnaK suppressor protein